MKLPFIRFGRNNESARLSWLQRQLGGLPSGLRLLEAGAGELRNKAFCRHLDYVSQDFCQYEGKGDGSALQTGRWVHLAATYDGTTNNRQFFLDGVLAASRNGTSMPVTPSTTASRVPVA